MATTGAVLTEGRVAAYLERLGVPHPGAPSLDALRRLHAAHLHRIPFENLSIHLGEEIVLEPEALVAKVVDRRRGGFCYELNGAFAALLRALGFDVTMLAARVFDGDRLGPPFDHLCLRVELDEPWLADVGFGDSFALPLRLADEEPQVDASGVFRIVRAGAEHRDLVRDDEAQYRFDLTPRELADYAPACRHHQTSPESHFTHNPVCTIATADGRITLRGHLLITTVKGERSERRLTDAEALDAYRRHFGIELTRLPPDTGLAPTAAG